MIFMDIDTIEPGADFVEVINDKVGSCDALIAVIGRKWVVDEEGRRRLDNPEDFIGLEISAALARKIRIIPVLVGGSTMPQSKDLPSNFAALARRQALEISDTRFHQDVDRLIGALEKAIAAIYGQSKTPAQSTVPEGVYIDPETKLMWTIADNGEDIDWNEATEYASQLRLGGYADWRLPTIEELEQLHDSNNGNRIEIRKPFRLTSENIWSSMREGRHLASYYIFGPGILKDPVRIDRATARALCVRRFRE
jgi:hypothetical protein